MSQHDLSPSTRAVRAAVATDRDHAAVMPPLHLSSTFALEGLGKPRAFGYTRTANPTRAHLADALAELEGGEGAVVTSTGMSAVTLVLQLVGPGETVVVAPDTYGGTNRLLNAFAGRGLLDTRFVDLTAPDAPARIREARPKLVWIETPSNPLLRVTDIAVIAAAARDAGALVAVDNTFLSPVLQQPIALGADLVVHSTTKYLNGHSDVVGGAVVARDREIAEQLAWWANCLGITGAPFDSYLTLRGIRTLHVRVRQHLESAQAVVEALLQHPAVKHVYYPGLADHPGHDIARVQQKGFGAMVSFELRDAAQIASFVDRLRCFTLAESLGGVESLIAHPATMTHASVAPETRRAAGISDGLLRLSVGIESPEDLARDISAALDYAVKSARKTAVKSAVINDRSPADVIVLGAGAIGRELAAQVAGVARDGNSPIRISGLIDRSGYHFDPDGLGAERVADLCRRKAAGESLASIPGVRASDSAAAVDEITRLRLTRPILVDVTPSDTTDILIGAIGRGADVVLANKIPLAGAQESVDRLHDAARRGRRRILYEATVGAGLPILDTLEKLRESGDRILSIEGCPSGTLGFLFAELGRGERFSVALCDAIARGYTEPDPRVDLRGLDVARKALILARAIGYRGELDDAGIESLVPAELAGVPLDEFLGRAAELDDRWLALTNDARRKKRVLRYRAHVTATTISVGLVPVKMTDPLGALNGTDNQFTFTTERYRGQPLVITGPGAGSAVTAAGVFNDVLRLQRQA